jgi:signal transduction histidine kinase
MLLHLRPLAVEAGGLPGALGQLAESWAALHGVQAFIDIAPLTGLPAAVEDHLYPIAQEALHNIARHARAGQVWVTLSEDDGAALLTIRDDGCGLAVGVTPGWGIAHMRERAEALGGAFSIARDPAGGTIVRARVPLRNAG